MDMKNDSEVVHFQGLKGDEDKEGRDVQKP